jgi:hypothetical protein
MVQHLPSLKTALLAFALITILNVQSQPGAALHFDGVDDRVATALPSIFPDAASKDFTVQLWLNPASYISRPLFAQNTSTDFISFLLNASGNVYFFVRGASSNSAYGAPIPLNTWTHITATWTSSTNTVKLYYNGAAVSTTFGGTSAAGADNLMTIGSRTDGNQSFSGSIDEVRISDNT